MSTDLDFTQQGRRPTAAQIVAGWKRAGCPSAFSVTYGETYALFERSHWGWDDSGNGCRGVNRTAVVTSLNRVTNQEEK